MKKRLLFGFPRRILKVLKTYWEMGRQKADRLKSKREIKYIVVHHSATPLRDYKESTLSNWERVHKEKFFEKWDQPISVNSKYKHIAYHFVITPEGKIVATRDLDVVGYHAGNLEVNTKGIGICVVGNFESEKPLEVQKNILYKLIADIKTIHKKVEVKTHQEVKKNGYTACCGKNLIRIVVKKD